jgi:hypothetical protein
MGHWQPELISRLRGFPLPPAVSAPLRELFFVYRSPARERLRFP